MIQHYNPTARNFNPNGAAANSTHGNSTPLQVSPPPSPYLEARLANLETAHGDLRGEVNTLKELYHDIYKSFGKQALVDGAKPVNPPLQTNLVESRQSATHFNWELEQLSREVRESVNGDIDDQKANSSSTPKANRSVPSHARAASMASHGSGQKSVPPHLRGSKQSSAGNGNLYDLRMFGRMLLFLTFLAGPQSRRLILRSTGTSLCLQTDQSTQSFVSLQSQQQFLLPHCLLPPPFRVTYRFRASKSCLSTIGSHTTSLRSRHCLPMSLLGFLRTRR